MARINLLDSQTSNLIAAGEVVERPANVVKELLENAIDAKSTQIVTEIQGGGVELIRVTDNGCGMDKEDLLLSVRRHATSKIRTGDDLSSITTLGFRGEALAAISSTSRFTLLSKRAEDVLGHQINVEGEEVSLPEECGCADGTTVLVRDLFFNQPARRKFLKRAQTETAAILQYLQRIAVSCPHIAFRFLADGVTKLQTAGNGSLADCIYSVYGNEFFSSLVPLKESAAPFRVYGFITRPENARNNHSYQSFYINNRFVKSRTVQFALEDAYKSFVKSEKFPGCVLFLEVDPGEVDVNVHPAKLEVRFSREREVYNAVFHAVRSTLEHLSNALARDEYFQAVDEAKAGKNVTLPSIGETEEKPKVSVEVKSGSFHEKSHSLPLFSPAPSRGKPKYVFPKEKPEEKTVLVTQAEFVKELPPLPKTSSLPEKKEEEPLQIQMPGMLPEEEPKDNPLQGAGVLRGVLFHAYLLYETKEKVYLIDKHAAHERILYEALKKSHKKESVQLFMEPMVLTLAPMESAGIAQHAEELADAGFLLEEFGDNTFLLRGIPLEFVSLSQKDILALLEEAAKELGLGGRGSGAGEKKFDRTLYSIACKGAVKAGIPSTDADHEYLVEKLREIDNITVCPHGRPVLVSFTKKEIESMFLRT